MGARVLARSRSASLRSPVSVPNKTRAPSTVPEARIGTACTEANPASVAPYRHSEVEHPDAWAHRNLNELNRAYATAVREMSTVGNASVGIAYGRVPLAQLSDSYLNEIASRTR